MPSIEQNPCYQCKKRHLHCHAHCEEDKAWQEKHKLVLQAKRDEQDYKAYIANQMYIKDKDKLERKKRRGI